MEYRYLIIDFDGVLAESNEIRFDGFRLLFKRYPEDSVKRLIQHVMTNAGLSRYEKIRYFFEEILNKSVSAGKIELLSNEYSRLVKEKVITAEPVKGSLEFLSAHQNDYDFAIISGSDEQELKEVCKARGIEHFFARILGSPLSKEENLAKLLKETGWNKELCLFIGDSSNDLEAVRSSGIDFVGRNSGLVNWNSLGNVPAIDDFSQLDLHLLKREAI